MEYKAEEILDVAIEIGVNLLQCGAEIRRVEDTITYICKAYGATTVDVFAIPSLILATIEVDGGTYTTKTKRNLAVSTDLFRGMRPRRQVLSVLNGKELFVESSFSVMFFENISFLKFSANS